MHPFKRVKKAVDPNKKLTPLKLFHPNELGAREFRWVFMKNICLDWAPHSIGN